MDCDTSTFYSPSQHLAAHTYFNYQTPPHSPYFWTDLMNTPAPPDDIYQMQHLRFPTPPITPPKSQAKQRELPTPPPTATTASVNVNATRTHSVIMKVGQGRKAEHMPATFYSNEPTDHSNSNCSINSTTSSSNSASSSPASDFICAWAECGRFFQSLEALAQHVTQMHAVPAPEDGLYYCHWHGCQRSERGFNARYKMLVHVRTHTKEKPHQCHMCEKSFSRAENLKIHIRSHSGEKPYKCTFEGCHKAYSNSSDRFKHTRTHTMEKPYMCKVPGCQKRYTDPSSLRKHVKTFKHSLQIISTASSADVANTISEHIRNTPEIRYSDDVMTCEPFGYSRPNSEYTISVIPAADHYTYMKMQAEHDFSLGASSRQSFYGHDTTYWLADSLAGKSLYAQGTLHSSDFGMDIDMDQPLDLRINRA